MKKLFTLLFVAGALCIISCGPSQADKDKASADSLKNALTMDSITNYTAASLKAAADSAQAVTDAAATAADSIAKASAVK